MIRRCVVFMTPIVLLLGTPAFAQSPLGIIGGLNIAKSTDFGLGFGAGVSFPAGNNSMFIEGRYALGLTDVAKAGVVEGMGGQLTVDDDVDIKTGGILLMAGITFPLGGK